MVDVGLSVSDELKLTRYRLKAFLVSRWLSGRCVACITTPVGETL